MTRHGSRPRSFESEYAASARDAGWRGERSSCSLPTGWLRRRPRSRATVSVPSMSIGSSPASRAASRIVRADGRSPAAATSCASSSRIVTIRMGSGGALCGLPSATIASCSSPRVGSRPAGRSRRPAPSRRRRRPPRSAARPSSARPPGASRRQRHVGLGRRGQRQRGEPADDDPGEPRPHVCPIGRRAGLLDRRDGDTHEIRNNPDAHPLERRHGAGDDPRLGPVAGAEGSRRSSGRCSAGSPGARSRSTRTS